MINDVNQNNICQNDTSQDDTCPNDISENDTYDSKHEKRHHNNISTRIHDGVYMINVIGYYQQLTHHHHYYHDHHCHLPQCLLHMPHHYHLPCLYQTHYNIDLSHEDQLDFLEDSGSAKKNIQNEKLLFISCNN
jgi:hypothetical protein